MGDRHEFCTKISNRGQADGHQIPKFAQPICGPGMLPGPAEVSRDGAGNQRLCLAPMVSHRLFQARYGPVRWRPPRRGRFGLGIPLAETEGSGMFRTFAKLDLASLALRLALAAIFISLGVAKLNGGWGTSWDHNPVAFTPALQAAIAWCELLAGIGMLLGLLTRVSAFALLVVMIGEIWWMSFHPDFVARWHDRPQLFFSAAPVGWTYSYAVAGMCLALLVLGGGLLSLDTVLWRYLGRREDGHPNDTAVVTTPAPQSRAWNFRRVIYIFRPRRHGSLPG